MVLVFLLLILVPAIAWSIAWVYRPNSQWIIAGTSFGMIAYPFFVGLSMPLVFAGFPISFISSAVMLLHRAPGHQIVVEIVGHKRLTGIEDLWVYALNAIIWGAVYGFIGWSVDSNRARNSNNVAP